MPIRAMPSGMPTAQPTMMGVLDLDSDPEESVGEAPEVEDPTGGGVLTTVLTTVSTPLLPEVTEVCKDVKGVVGPVGVDLAEEGEFLVVESGESSEDEAGDEGGGVEEGELLSPPPPVAEPVIEARFGTSFAVDFPIIAYCWPSPRSKKGRGSGLSLQQSTSTLFASQHH